MRVWKQPAEKRVYTYDFAALLAGQTIQSIVSATSAAREGVTTLTNLAQLFTATKVQVTWGGGTDGIAYRTTVIAKDASNQEHELDGEIFVSATTFVLPVGITSVYLEGKEYVDRFGYEETVRVTDELKRGTIDGAALMAAIADAQQFAEGYLAVRYTLPIARPPELLKAIVADLARERLHKTRPTQTVTANGDRARALLKDLSAGRATLLVSSVEVKSTGNASPAWSPTYDATIFNADKLARF